MEIVPVEAEGKDLDKFRRQFNIEEDRFKRTVRFVELILDGYAKTRAYQEAFSVDKTKANTLASQLHRTKWVQELIMYMRPDDDSLYFGERKNIIATGMSIINDMDSSNRDKIEAIKALQPFIKEARKEAVENVQDTTVGDQIAQKITDKLEELANQGKMIDDSGNIIDVVEIS